MRDSLPCQDSFLEYPSPPEPRPAEKSLDRRERFEIEHVPCQVMYAFEMPVRILGDRGDDAQESEHSGGLLVCVTQPKANLFSLAVDVTHKSDLLRLLPPHLLDSDIRRLTRGAGIWSAFL
jgi:hypothetical protein